MGYSIFSPLFSPKPKQAQHDGTADSGQTQFDLLLNSAILCLGNSINFSLRYYDLICKIVITMLCQRVYILGPGWLLIFLKHCPIHQKVVGSIPSRGMYGRQLNNVSLLNRSLSLSLSLSLCVSLSLCLSLILSSPALPPSKV